MIIVYPLRKTKTNRYIKFFVHCYEPQIFLIICFQNYVEFLFGEIPARFYHAYYVPSLSKYSSFLLLHDVHCSPLKI
jgi:hypothetical protein